MVSRRRWYENRRDYVNTAAGRAGCGSGHGHELQQCSAPQGNIVILTSAADGGPATSAQRETGLLRVWSEVYLYNTLELYSSITMIYLHIIIIIIVDHTCKVQTHIAT